MLIPENFYVDNLSLPYFILISLFTRISLISIKIYVDMTRIPT